MPDTPEAKPDEANPESVVVAPPSGPSNDELMAALESERYQKNQLAAQNAEIMARQMTRPSQPQGPPELDMKKLGEDLLVNPDAAVNKLNQFVDQKVAAATSQIGQQVGNYVAQQANANRTGAALQNVFARYPDLASQEGQEKLMGKATEVALRAQRQGLGNLPVEQILESAVREMGKTTPGRSATPPPVIEGGSNPSMGQNLRPQAQPEQNALERHYKLEPGTIVMQEDPENYTKEYVKWMNERGALRGARSKIPQVQYQVMNALAEAAANKASGGKA